MKKILLCCFILGLSSSVFAAQTTLTDMPSLKVGNAINIIGVNVQGNTTKQNAMNTELYAAMFDVAADYTVTGSWDFTGATVTGISGTGGSTDAADINVADSGGLWTETTVEAILANIGAWPKVYVQTSGPCSGIVATMAEGEVCLDITE